MWSLRSYVIKVIKHFQHKKMLTIYNKINFIIYSASKTTLRIKKP